MRNTMKTAARPLLGIALAGAAACGGATGDATGPAPGPEMPDTPHAPAVAGTYTLTLVNGGPLPALLWYDNTAGDMDAEMYLLSGSIVLRDDGTFRSTTVSQLVIQGVGEQVSTSITDGTYLYVHNPAAECEPSECVEGKIMLTAENGGQGTVFIAGDAIASQAQIPGAPGQPDITVQKIYER